MDSAVSHKSYTATLLLAIFSGFAGFHRFYVGKEGTGLLWFLTAGMFVFGWLIQYPQVGSVILGARTTDQLADNMGAVDITLSKEQWNKLDEASAPHCLTTPMALWTR